MDHDEELPEYDPECSDEEDRELEEVRRLAEITKRQGEMTERRAQRESTEESDHMYDKYDRRDDHPDYGVDSICRREVEALQKAAAAEARCQLMEEMMASGGSRPAGSTGNFTHQPGKAKMDKEPPVFDGSLPATDVTPWLKTVNNYLKLNGATIEQDKWPAVGRSFLDGAAARSMDSAILSLPVGVTQTWQQFEQCLLTSFGHSDAEEEHRKGLRGASGKQKSKTVTEYVRHMQSCFEGITVLPLSMGDKIERFIQGLNDDLRIRILPAPVGAGVQGKWIDICDLMNYAIQLSHNLPREGAITVSAAASQNAAPRGRGRSSGPAGLCAGRGIVKHRSQASADGQASGPYVRSSNRRPPAEEDWLNEKKQCFFCCEIGHRSNQCNARQVVGAKRAPMPAEYSQSK